MEAVTMATSHIPAGNRSLDYVGKLQLFCLKDLKTTDELWEGLSALLCHTHDLYVTSRLLHLMSDGNKNRFQADLELLAGRLAVAPGQASPAPGACLLFRDRL